MEVVVSKSAAVKVMRSKEEILSLLKECSKSKMSVKEFVKANGIHEATFYHWRNKYRNKPRAKKVCSGFAALKINPSPATQAVASFAEVKGIRIYQPVSSSYLKELL